MFTNRLFNVLIVLALGVGAVLTVREAVATSAVMKEETGATASQKALSEFDPAEASAYRWQAVADFYKRNGLLTNTNREKALTEFDTAEALAYRWQAMADFYQTQGLLTRVEPQLPLTGPAAEKSLTEYDAAEALAYRWQAMADFYKTHGLLTQVEP